MNDTPDLEEYEEMARADKKMCGNGFTLPYIRMLGVILYHPGQAGMPQMSIVDAKMPWPQGPNDGSESPQTLPRPPQTDGKAG